MNRTTARAVPPALLAPVSARARHAEHDDVEVFRYALGVQTFPLPPRQRGRAVGPEDAAGTKDGVGKR